jgi:uncharacterized FAD-dependent dehydrogenase
MKQLISLTLPPEIAFDEPELVKHLHKKYASPSNENFNIRVLKTSIDARKQNIKINLDIELAIDQTNSPLFQCEFDYQDVSNKPQAIIIGAGPAGMFAALRLVELGVKPIILERGKDVRARRRDLAAINKDHIVNAESNYCFGEGGAGTYSDGKLYTRSKKRGDIRRVLELLVQNGATEKILSDAHPHIGTNKLPQVVQAIREQILKFGGEIRFDTKVTDFILEDNELKGVITEGGKELTGIGVILATGHSARDIFELLHKKGIQIEAKPFAMGVRIEHPQELINACQYHRPERGLLPPASYSLVSQTKYKGIQRGVFSFCMCPGGFIVPAATAPGELVVNGMSPSRRNSKFANSGMVVAINEPDWQTYKGAGELAALRLQEEVEKRVWEAGNLHSAEHSQFSPAQRIGDFINRNVSKELNATSYQPGLISADFFDVLPDFIAHPLREGLIQFGKRMKGYASNQGQLIGIESRTSSPVRIPRIKETFEHVQTKRFFPCGEGAGYAGGIMSAAMDGERCAEALAGMYSN